MAKEAFTTWNPKPETLARLRVITKVLAGYDKMGIRLTLRQLFYQLVSQNVIANTQREYKRLGNLLSDARLAGYVDWDIIEDRVRRPQRALQFANMKERVNLAVDNFRLRRWDDQPVYVELWCEKDALSSVLEPICDDLHVTLMVNRGYSSSSAMYEAAKRIQKEQSRRAASIIYLGDFDPSGEDMVRDVADRLTTFKCKRLDVTKLALTRHQVDEYKLPPNPLKRDHTGKLTDSRGQAFEDKHGGESFEVDALPPDVLQTMVRDAITEHMDLDKYEAVKEREDELKRLLVDAAGSIE
jgi:hypothetical protein